MTRLEASAFPLACGSACVFVLAVALHRLPWEAAFAVIALAVSAWAWRSPLIVGVVVGGIAWLCVTGFDVHRLGDIRVTGIDDAARAAVLVLAGVLTAAAHALAGARHGPGVRTRSGPPSTRPALSRALARACIELVMSVSAGPPLGGLYLKPPSSGGLCDGVITTPSAKPFSRPLL